MSCTHGEPSLYLTCPITKKKSIRNGSVEILFALSIFSRLLGDGKAVEWIENGNQWMQTNQPNSLILLRLRGLATYKGYDASLGTER